MTSSKTITKSAFETGLHSQIKVPLGHSEFVKTAMDQGFNLSLLHNKKPHMFNLAPRHCFCHGSVYWSQEKSWQCWPYRH